MNNDWLETRLLSYIDNQIQEGSNLEYKAAESLQNTDEITKDVSAMANASGGIIIYGIAEPKDKAKRHLPERLSPIDRIKYSKEWLEQIINTIKPKIIDFKVVQVQLSSSQNDVAYVVSVPLSTTAHQARDHRYYRRYNFQCLPMEDQEIRDVMNRNTHPQICLEFQLEILTEDAIEEILSGDDGAVRRSINLDVYAYNEGAVFAQYVVAEVLIPNAIFTSQSNSPVETIEDIAYRSFSLSNERKEQDLVPNLRGGFTRSEKYTGSYYPVLPRNSVFLSTIHNVGNFDISDHKELQIQWVVYADNAQPITGQIRIANLEITEMDITD